MVIPSTTKWISLIAADLRRMGDQHRCHGNGLAYWSGIEVRSHVPGCAVVTAVTDRHAITAVLS
jgi:hypothetical protein